MVMPVSRGGKGIDEARVAADAGGVEPAGGAGLRPERSGCVGKFTYNSTVVVEIDDRVLAHLQIVIGAKLRRNESFYFSWRDDASSGDGRSVIWLNPAISLVYKFHGGRQPSINRDWIEELMVTANSSAGLRIIAEPSGGSQNGAEGSEQ
jgi:hypothetical protein